MTDPAGQDGHETGAGAPPAGAPDRHRPRGFFWIELLAVIFTIACVWLTAEEHILCWPTGIIGCVLYLYVFWVARLYSDVLLQLYFLVTSIWGWYHWLYGGVNATELPITRITAGWAALWAGVIVAGTAALGAFMKRRTRAALPYLDATTTVISLVAQYLLGCKILENWVLWIGADVIDSGIYFRRRLYMTSLLYAVLLVLATMGLIEWRGKL